MNLNLITQAVNKIAILADIIESEIVSKVDKERIYSDEENLLKSEEYNAFASFLRKHCPSIEELTIRIAFEIAYLGITQKDK